VVKATITLGSRTWEIEREGSFANSTHSAYSYCLVCPSCTRVWASHRLSGDRLLWPRAGFCEDCPSSVDNLRPVPGSILVQEGLDVIDDALVEALPLELLKREYDLHTKVLINE
jgi:hypothetical protein